MEELNETDEYIDRITDPQDTYLPILKSMRFYFFPFVPFFLEFPVIS